MEAWNLVINHGLTGNSDIDSVTYGCVNGTNCYLRNVPGIMGP